MARLGSCIWLTILLVSASARGQDPGQSPMNQPIPPPPPPPPATSTAPLPPSEDLPPEEDESVAPDHYSFNPIECDRNIKVGMFYMHKGSFRAAAVRFDAASKWNPTSAEAFFRLGEARDKLKDKAKARLAYEKVVQIAPDSRQAHEAKKKLGKG